LEECLRSLVETLDTPYAGKSSIEGYVDELHRRQVLTLQGRKEVTAWAGRRNVAAHGHIGKLDADTARLMAEGIKVFMRSHPPTVSG
jgi:hypothetical protein